MKICGNFVPISRKQYGKRAEFIHLVSQYNQLTTSMPQAFHVAIKRDRKVTVPSFPKVEIHHYTEALLGIGVMTMEIDGFNIRLYDVERCICDAVKFRNLDQGTVL